MPQTKVAQPSHSNLSNIPVASPRSVRSVMPGPLPSDSTSLRSGAVSVSTSITTTGNVSGSGIPAFRALRSLLPFGPGRLPTPIASNPSSNVTKGSFMTFGSVRRSMTGERKNSLSYSRPEEMVESPVISIHSSDDTEKVKYTFQKDESHVICEPIRVHALPISPSTESTASSLPQGSPLPTELSTIIEADTSGLSTHVPPLRDPRPNGCLGSPHPDLSFSTPTESGLPGFFSALDTENLCDGNERTLDCPDDSALDLPTSRLEVEVRDAMKVEGHKSAAWWLQDANVPIVDVTEQSTGDQYAEDEPSVADANPNVSFNLDALDPDLAVLLSSNRIRSKKTAASDLIVPKSFGSTLPGPQKPSRIPSPPSSDLMPPHSSPVRRTVLNSSSSRIPSSSSLPRLRPTTSQPTPLRPNKELPLLPSVSIYPEVQTSDDAGLQGSVESLRHRRSPPPPPSPGSISLEGQNVSWNPPYRKLPQSRLMTPSRHSSYSSTGGQRPRFRPSPPKVDGGSSSSSPAYSSLGNAASTRLLGNLRVNLDSDSRTDTAERDRPHILRSRKRSMSLEAHRTSPGSTASYHTRSYLRPSSSLSYARPTPEWLGPRTARAFAAAGLLNMDRDSTITSGRSVSRAGHVRGGGEQDSRTQHTPSRTAISEASGSISSWGRSGSISNTVTTSEAGGRVMESPTFSSITPRTNFSGGSTAATSISAVSSTQYQLQSTIQSMKERHEVETEALLAALSDSQRTTKVLRGEIFELRERMQYLEDQLVEARLLLRRYQSSPSTPLSHSTPGVSVESRTRTGSTDEAHRQLQSPPSLDPPPHASLVKGHTHRDSTVISPPIFELPSKAQIKRFSTTSSVFPVPPSNMTMLMTEEGVIPDRSGVISSRSISPPSSTFPLSVCMRHSHNRSMSSGGNISPKTANFSMTEMTGSPGSLCLRPEHEMHLGDMVSLDLGYNRGEEIGGDTEY